MKATSLLKTEHDAIKVMLRIMRAVSGKLDRGEEVDSQHLEDILEFLSVFADKCHHGKEEGILFQALEAAGMPREGGPIGVMLMEHDEGRGIISKLRDAVKAYTSGDRTAAGAIRNHMNAYASLLSQHIDKENNILYPMAESVLSEDKDKELVDAYEEFEREHIGPGKHEELHQVLHRLEHEYLGQ